MEIMAAQSGPAAVGTERKASAPQHAPRLWTRAQLVS